MAGDDDEDQQDCMDHSLFVGLAPHSTNKKLSNITVTVMYCIINNQPTGCDISCQGHKLGGMSRTKLPGGDVWGEFYGRD